MRILYIFAFLGLTASWFFIFHIDLLSFIYSSFGLFKRKKVSLATRIKRAKKAKKQTALSQLIQEAHEVMSATGRESKVGMLVLLSLGLFILGVILSLAMDNLFMLPILSSGLALLPLVFVLLSAGRFRKRLAGELETAMSVITSSYLRNESFVQAVEENLSFLQPPVSDVFNMFVAKCRFISADISEALDELETKFSNQVFREWVSAMKGCQSDRTLKSTLMPIVRKLSDSRIVTGEFEVLIAQPMKEYATMAFLLVANIPLIYFINRSWFEILVNTLPGKACLAASALVLVISLIGAVRISRPIEFKE